MAGAIGAVADVVAPIVSPILGSVAQDVGQVVGGLGQDVGGVVNQLMGSLNPLQGLLGGGQSQGAGFNPLNPFPFSVNIGINGMNPSSNPFPTICGGGSQPGLPGMGGPGSESWPQLQNQFNSAVQSGDPMQMMQAQQAMSQYSQMINLMSAMNQQQNQMIQGMIKAIQ